MNKNRRDNESDFRQFLRDSVATWGEIAIRNGTSLEHVASAVRDMAESIIRIEIEPLLQENAMGMIKIEMWGSFPVIEFSTCAEEGGHVAALKRGIEFLADKLSEAVVTDAQLTKEGIAPPKAPLGEDVE